MCPPSRLCRRKQRWLRLPKLLPPPPRPPLLVALALVLVLVLVLLVVVLEQFLLLQHLPDQQFFQLQLVCLL